MEEIALCAIYIGSCELWESKFIGLPWLRNNYRCVGNTKIIIYKFYDGDSGSGLQLHSRSSPCQPYISHARRKAEILKRYNYFASIFPLSSARDIIQTQRRSAPSAEFGGNIGIFGLKTPLHAYTRIIVLGIYRTSFQHNLHCFINACVHVVTD